MRLKISPIPAVALLAACLAFPASAQDRAVNDFFDVRFGPSGIAGLRRAADPNKTNFISIGESLGHIALRYRMAARNWRNFDSASLSESLTVKQGREGSTGQRIFIYNGSGWYDYFADLEFTCRFRLEAESLYWTLHLRNVTHKPIEIAWFYLPLPMGKEGEIRAESFIRGRGSYVTWSAARGGPILVMVPIESCPLFEPAQNERNFASAGLELADDWGVYLHAAGVEAKTGESPRENAPPRSNLVLTPKFTPGDEVTYGFKFRWAGDEEDVRRLLLEEGLMDVRRVVTIVCCGRST